MAVDEMDSDTMTGEELAERLREEGVTLAGLMEIEGLREEILRALVSEDVETHRDIHDRLAGS